MRERGNYQGYPCKNCGAIIIVFSSSGYCRKCFFSRRRQCIERNCSECQHPISKYNKTGLCQKCLGKKRRNPSLNTYKYLAVDGQTLLEHRYVWERANGLLPSGWVVHHLNGLKGDNRLENLLAIPRDKHHKHLVEDALKSRIRELEAKL